MMSLSSKCTWRVVVFRSFVRFSKFHSRVVVISTCNFFKVHLARGSCSFMGSLFKVPLARASDPHMSLFSKCTSRVVVVRFSKFHSRVVVIRQVTLVCFRLYQFGLNSLTLGCLMLGYVGLCFVGQGGSSCVGFRYVALVCVRLCQVWLDSFLEGCLRMRQVVSSQVRLGGFRISCVVLCLVIFRLVGFVDFGFAFQSSTRAWQ